MCVAEPNMAVHQSKHQSDLEKRLKILRQQFYGKSSDQTRTTRIDQTDQKTSEPEKLAYRLTGTPTPSGSASISESFRSDTSYLRTDLIKISILAGAALGIQFLLYFSLNNNILNINLF